MVDVALAGLAPLFAVRVCGHLVGATDRRDRSLGVLGAEGRDEGRDLLARLRVRPSPGQYPIDGRHHTPSSKVVTS